MTIIKYLIIVNIVPLIVDLFNYKNESKNYTKSINKFTIRTGKSVLVVGALWFMLASALLIGWVYYDEEFSVVAVVLFALFYSLSLISFLYAAPRFWDIVVDGDDITVIKCFIFTKHVEFSNLDRVEIAKNNYIKVYKDGKKWAFFLIDPMMKGKNNFLKRIEKEGIKIDDKR